MYQNFSEDDTGVTYKRYKNNNPPLQGVISEKNEMHNSQDLDQKNFCQWGDFQFILEFDIFVKYDSTNLIDFRHFSRFWLICTVNGIWVGIKTCEWALRRASGH